MLNKLKNLRTLNGNAMKEAEAAIVEDLLNAIYNNDEHKNAIVNMIDGTVMGNSELPTMLEGILQSLYEVFFVDEIDEIVLQGLNYKEQLSLKLNNFLNGYNAIAGQLPINNNAMLAAFDRINYPTTDAELTALRNVVARRAAERAEERRRREEEKEKHQQAIQDKNNKLAEIVSKYGLTEINKMKYQDKYNIVKDYVSKLPKNQALQELQDPFYAKELGTFYASIVAETYSRDN